MLENNLNKKSLGKLPDSKLRLSDLFITLSSALDMGHLDILDHSRKVAYISLEIAEAVGLEESEINKIVLAALIHDLGINDQKIKEKAQNFFDVELDLIQYHCKRGAELSSKLSFFPELADIIYYHHHKWAGDNFDNVKGVKIPLASRIIHLSDRIEASIDPNTFILNQVDNILDNIYNKSAVWFEPKLVNIFSDLAKSESFWLNLKTKEYKSILGSWGKKTNSNINLSDLGAIASTAAHLIDRVSPFTSRHSTGVATIAAMITNEMGYGSEEQSAIRIAGLFHDLGKLVIPNEIIEKKSKLNDLEFKIIKQHSFYTYRLLSKIKGLGSIPEWAAYHHERLDGTGYPFRIKAENLNLGSRIMAVSDIFQALTEDRPYRPAFSISKSIEIIEDMENEFKLDSEVIKILKKSI